VKYYFSIKLEMKMRKRKKKLEASMLVRQMDLEIWFGRI
jgi:hypothetical protein